MSSRDGEPFDWLNKFFGRWGEKGRGFGFPDIFRGFGEMRREMEREFQDVLKDIQAKAPKDLVREYETKEGEKGKEYGPFVYGYSMTVGPDGRPKVREFGNVRSPFSGKGLFTRPYISSESGASDRSDNSRQKCESGCGNAWRKQREHTDKIL